MTVLELSPDRGLKDGEKAKALTHGGFSTRMGSDMGRILDCASDRPDGNATSDHIQSQNRIEAQ